MPSTHIKLTKGNWSKIDPAGSTVTQITHNTGDSAIIYTESALSPKPPTPTSPVANVSYKGNSIYFALVKKSEFIWACSINDDAHITVTKGE